MPHFRPSWLFKVVTALCNLILLYGIYNDITQIVGGFSPKHVIILIEITYTASSIFAAFIFFIKNDIRMKESHGLITLINNKFRFDVGAILTSKQTKRLHDISLFLVLALVIEELIMFCVDLIVETVDNELLIRMSIIELFIVSTASFGFYALHCLSLYGYMFDNCYQEIEKYFDDLSKIEPLRHKLRKIQRLYMCLRRNFLINEKFVTSEIMILYSINVCLLLIGYVYFAVLFVMGEVPILKFDIFLILKSLGLFVSFAIICFQAEKVATTSQDILSFLFKCPVSKLSAQESAQIEMLITTLIIQKPVLKASDIFTIGTGLIASVSGTVLTYVLVALQFHALWSK